MKQSDSIQYLKGVGPKMANILAKLGIGEIGDLLTHYPRRYLNLSQPQKIKDLIFNDLNVIEAKVVDIDFSPISLSGGGTGYAVKISLPAQTNDFKFL